MDVIKKVVRPEFAKSNSTYHLFARVVVLAGFVLFSNNATGQNLGWKWVSGNSGTNKSASYGTKGTAASTNKPGPRVDGVTWTDSNGDLWLFGGHGKASSGTGFLSDLWKYDASTDEWTWISGPNTKDSSGTYGTKGTASSSNIPGGRWGHVGWIDSNDDLWLFGGYGYDVNGDLGYLNDLWKYDVSDDKWAWTEGFSTRNQRTVINRSSNMPGGRSELVAWADNDGDLWLFGGYGYDKNRDLGYLADVWKYDVSDTKWIYSAGAVVRNATIHTSPYRPGACRGAVGITMSDGDLVLFGGHGYINSGPGWLNSLLRFDVATETWSVLSGGGLNSAHQKTGSTIKPGGLENASGWIDASGNFCIYGGENNSGDNSDLWKWDGSAWTWEGDGNAAFGTQDFLDLDDYPGPRHSAMCSNSGNDVWLFGGSGTRNDLWRCKVLNDIANGGSLTATSLYLKLTSTETSGDALQDDGDFVAILDFNGAFGTTTDDLPNGTNLISRTRRSYRLDFNDVNSNGGTLAVTFTINSSLGADRSFYLLSRSGTSGSFSVVNTIDYDLTETSVKFWLDLSSMTREHYYTLGWSDKDAGYALNLDSDNSGGIDRIQFPITLDAKTSNFTAECWLKPSAIGSKQTLFDQRSGTGTAQILLRINSDGTLSTFLGGTQKRGRQVLSANKWTHVAASYDGTDIRFYVNGSLDTTHTVAAQGYTGSWIFGSTRMLAEGFDGEIDELRIWNDERTITELEDNLHRPLLGNESNLIGYYKFDQMTGTNLPDVSANRENGTLLSFALSGNTSNWVSSTAPIVAQAQMHHIKGPGSCLTFDGSDDYVQVSSFLNPSSSNWTMEGWFNSSSLTTVLMSQLDGSGTGRQLMRLENGLLKTSIDGSGITGTTTIGTGEWHHFAMTFDGTTLRMYLDGLLEASSNISISSATGNYQIGCNKGRSIFFEGKLDELRFWSATRTQAEIQDNMYTSVASDATGLLAYYPCDHFNGTSLEDESSNSNTGTLNDFPWNCWTSAADREPFKTIKAGNHNSSSTWKEGSAPSSSSDQLAIFHDVTLNSTGTYEKMHVNSGVTVTTSADVTVNGDVVINGSLSGANKIILGGSSKQCLGGSGTLGALQVNNSNDVSLEGDLTISGALTLTSGDIEVNGHTLTLTGTTSHGSSTSYLKLNGTGSVKATVGADPVILPVGRNPYLPIIIDDGGDAEYTVGVADRVYSNPTTQTTELTQDCVSETWTVQASQSVSNVSIQIGWDAAEETTGFTRNKCAIGYWENSVSSSWTKGTGGAATGSDPYFHTISMSSMSTNLYYFGVGSQGSPLPVELTYFNANWIEQGTSTPLSAQLIWSTAVELNNSHFEIERSIDGIHFEVIGRIEGNGTTNSPQQYSFTDQNVPNGEDYIYYRLKQVDYDGQYEYSDVRTLQASQNAMPTLNVYPNPAVNQLYIDFSAPVESVRVYNTLGELVPLTYQTNTLNVESLSPGNYILEASSGNRNLIKRARFVIDK